MVVNLKCINAMSVALLTLGAAVLQPLAQAQIPANSDPSSMPARKASSSAMPADSKAMKGMDMKGMMKDNNDKMSSMHMSGSADVDFALMMRMHHQGAIDMAQAELRDGKVPEMRKMAQNIIAAQKKEIVQLDKFLIKHGHAHDKQAK